MSAEKYDIQITAKSVEQFNKAKDLLDTLPVEILSKIERAKFGGVGLECTFKQDYDDNGVKVRLPNTVTQITQLEDYIGIYCQDFFFKIEGAMQRAKITYLFMDLGKCKKS